MYANLDEWVFFFSRLVSRASGRRALYVCYKSPNGGEEDKERAEWSESGEPDRTKAARKGGNAETRRKPGERQPHKTESARSNAEQDKER